MVSLWKTIWLIRVSILLVKGSSAFCVGIQLAIVLKKRQKKVLGKVESGGVEGGRVGPQSENSLCRNVLAG